MFMQRAVRFEVHSVAHEARTGGTVWYRVLLTRTGMAHCSAANTSRHGRAGVLQYGPHRVHMGRRFCEEVRARRRAQLIEVFEGP